jgi:hypothetical protein
MWRSGRRTANAYSDAAGWLVPTLRAMILLSLAWQGPIPWCHSHGTWNQLPVASRSWLASHLCAYHPGDSGCTGECLGWHFHAVFPGTNPEDAPQQPGTDIGQLAVPAPCDVECEPLSRHLPFLRLPSQDSRHGSVAVASAGTWDGGTHFFDCFAPSLAFPVRLGVLRL